MVMVTEQRTDDEGVAEQASHTNGGGTSQVDVIPFLDALALAQGHGRRHLMLGNGFSIAIRPGIFSYNTLLERARDSGHLTDEMARVFDELGTTDFESVMEAHERAAVLVSIYEGENPRLAARLRDVAADLRNVLAETISDNHPSRPNEIGGKQYAACRRFLSHFDGNIYTLNYDLLLYWTLMQGEIPPELKSDDGFRHPEHHEQDYVVWEVQNSKLQNVYFLHGALHIYDGGAELLKYTWSKTDIPLVDQIRRSLEERKYPLIVTEGTCEQKLSKLQHSGFLNRAYRSFSGIGGSLFVYGHSFAENDEHLLKLIDGSKKLEKLFVGLYGDANQPGNQSIIRRAWLMNQRQEGIGRKLDVHFFDARSAHVWDGEGFDDSASAEASETRATAVGGS